MFPLLSGNNSGDSDSQPPPYGLNVKRVVQKFLSVLLHLFAVTFKWIVI